MALTPKLALCQKMGAGQHPGPYSAVCNPTLVMDPSLSLSGACAKGYPGYTSDTLLPDLLRQPEGKATKSLTASTVCMDLLVQVREIHTIYEKIALGSGRP